MISGKDIGRPESKISFLFLVMYDGELETGKIVNKYTKENFLVGLQSLFQEALHAPERYEKVYIPLIGAGNGEVGTKRQITSLLNALIQYNLDELKNRELEMHIIIREKNRKEVPIYLFSKIDSF